MKKDEFSPFRHTMSKIKDRYKYYNYKGRNRQEVHITLQDLKDQWDLQEGKCPICGVKLILKTNSNKKNVTCNPYQASLDRVDSDKPYEKGNIRFVSLMANYAKNNFTDEQLIDFCGKVIKTHS